MIRFALKCDQEHSFESWFQSGAAFDKVNSVGMVTCPSCGSSSIQKTLMAPRVQTARTSVSKSSDEENKPNSDLPVKTVTSPSTALCSVELEAKIATLKEHVEANSDYVGEDFAREARAMHDGEKPERAIYGETKVADAMELIDEGIKIAPLPFIPARKTN